MRFEDLNWMDVENYLKQDDRCLLVLGACEQHGYLSLLSDSKIPQAIADAASQSSGVPVAPVLNFGVSPYFLTYPGTISLRTSTYLQVVEDIVRSLYGYGFRKMVILNGHGGNVPARNHLVELLNQLPDLKLAWYSWWVEPHVLAVVEKHQLQPYHASWFEAFRFTRVCELPAGEKTAVDKSGLLSAAQSRALFGDGVFGGKYQVEDAIMEEILEAAAQDVLELLKFGA